MKRFFLASISLIAGSIIYVLWRSETLTMFIWFEWIGIASFVESARNITQWLSMYFPNWLLFSLPNALWLFSGILLFDSIWGVKRSAAKSIWLSLFIIIAICSEIGQGLEILPGNFDWQDITFMILAIVSAFVIISYLRQQERRYKL